jgi:hypothetical protein
MDQHEFIMSFMELIILKLPDHFPVSARLQLKALSLDGNTATNITCNGVANGTATVTVSGGISPYTYTWVMDKY